MDMKSDYIYVTGDFNARVVYFESDRHLWRRYTNRNGQELRQFLSFYQLKITNTFYRKRDTYRYTWASRGQESLIDYIIINNAMKDLVKYTNFQRF